MKAAKQLWFSGTGNRIGWTIGLLVLLGACIAYGQLAYGSPTLSVPELARIMFGRGGEELQRIIVLDMRVPRLVLGLLVGAMLGAAGTIMQGAMNNVLAGPELLGVSSGSSLAIAIIAVLHLPLPLTSYPVFALLGGLLGGCLVVLAAKGSHGAISMLLIGLAVSAVLNGMLIILIALGTSNDVNLLYLYLLGSLANRHWDHVLHTIPWFLVAIPLSLACIRLLNVLRLGDESAASLGVSILRVRIAMLVLCTLLVAVTVAQCGPIGYISLLAPHLTRFWLGTVDAKAVLPLSMLVGAVLLVAADTAARIFLYPIEIPVGIWTTLLGGGSFLVLVLTGTRRRTYE